MHRYVINFPAELWAEIRLRAYKENISYIRVIIDGLKKSLGVK